MKPHSLVRQWLSATLLTLLVLWLAMVVSVAWVIKHETDEIFDSSLQEMAQRLLPLVVKQLQAHEPGHDEDTLLTDDDALDAPEHEEYVVYQVFDATGRMLLRSHSASVLPLVKALKPGFQRSAKHLIYIEKSRNGHYFLALAEKASHRTSTLLDTLKYLLLPLLALLPLSALSMLLIVRKASRPLRLLDKEISRRGSADLRPLPASDLPQELLPLTRTVNELMHRLQLALDAERQFAANSAHELRTPLAAAMAQLDVLGQTLSNDEQMQRLHNTRQLLHRLQALSEKLLQLARAESGIAWKNGQIDVVQLLQLLCHDQQWRTDVELSLHLPEQPVQVQGDVDALGIVLSNLLENAIKYGTPGHAVRIELSTAPTQIRISNDCEPLAQETLTRLVERFYRARPDSRGAGLGLSIVRALLAPARIDFQMHSPIPGRTRGFQACLSWGKDHTTAATRGAAGSGDEPLR